jgi:hypothetical protein
MALAFTYLLEEAAAVAPVNLFLVWHPSHFGLRFEASLVASVRLSAGLWCK